jgi:hypothetical protein
MAGELLRTPESLIEYLRPPLPTAATAMPIIAVAGPLDPPAPMLDFVHTAEERSRASPRELGREAAALAGKDEGIFVFTHHCAAPCLVYMHLLERRNEGSNTGLLPPL